MLKHLSVLTVPAALLAGLAIAPAQAQVGVQIGPGGVRLDDGRPRERVIIRERERRPNRVIVEDRRRGDCETITRTRVNRFGERVTTRERRC